MSIKDKKDKKDSVVLYGSYLKDIEDMKLEQIGLLFIAILSYASNREMPKISDAEVKGCFRLLKHQIDFDTQKYLDKCEQNRQNILKRYNHTSFNTNVYERIHNENENGNDKDKDKDNGNVVSLHNREVGEIK